MNETLAYKVLTAEQFMALEADRFEGAPIDITDGYIHLSSASQVTETVARHFAGQVGLIIAAIDLRALGGQVRWEISRNGQRFPHLYGRLAKAVVLAHGPVEWGSDGVVRLPAVTTDTASNAAEFELYDLKVEVVGPVGQRIYCGASLGDHFELHGEMLTLPPGQGFSIYSLAALLPLLPAKQRVTDPHDWMSTDSEVACPDPNCPTRFRITRLGKRRFTRSAVTATALPATALPNTALAGSSPPRESSGSGEGG
jgi:uncharacterized repeat protein (TIGR04076 family)